MTLVAGFATPYAAFMVADSRLVRMRNGELADRRDVCQKVFPLSNEILVGFSNGALSAVRLLRRLAASDYAKAPEWFLDRDRTLDVLSGLYQCAEAKKLAGPQVQLLLALHVKEPSATGDLVVPRVKLVHLDCDPWSHRIVEDDLAVIGAAADIRDRALKEDSAGKLAKLTSYSERGLAIRALFAHLFVCSLMRGRDEPTIGGLYQVYYLGPEGPRAVPYDTWGEITPDLGSPVSMFLESGEWAQEHKPTKLRVLVRNPLRDEGVVQRTGSELFAVREFLRPGSPGVRRRGYRVEWHSELHEHVYAYEAQTGAFTKRVVLPPVDSLERSAFGELLQPLVQRDALRDWLERPDTYLGPS
ncbi:MAG: hypothetical protein WBF66_02760 [Dehalococcoidia bacterium]